jgi:hypothetical protein
MKTALNCIVSTCIFVSFENNIVRLHQCKTDDHALYVSAKLMMYAEIVVLIHVLSIFSGSQIDK